MNNHLKSAWARHLMKQKRGRSENGNSLVLILAITVGLVLALIFFCLNYSRMLGSSAEQKKAIEAAALAAATDISNIVVDTAEMGYVSLSDQAPVGKLTKAGDEYFLPVRGINTIIGTARLDAIIADNIPNAAVMRQLAKNDFDAAKAVEVKLANVIKASLTPAGSSQAVDRDGNQVNPYTDAETAYKANVIRMTGTASYVNNSLNLQLGSSRVPSETNIPIPQPDNIAPINASLVQDNKYKAFVNIPYGGTNYVFGGIGDKTRLTDVRDWVATVPGLDYQVPTVVKAECDELIKTSQTPQGAVFHTAACAQASSNFDPKPAPGAVAIEFPDGQVPEFIKPGDLLTKINSPATVTTSSGGDYPISTSSMSPSPDPWPANVPGRTIQAAWQTTLFDWIRRGGTKANIAQVVAMQSNSFNAPPSDVDWWAELTTSLPLTNISTAFSPVGSPAKIPMGVMHSYKWDPNGNVTYRSSQCVAYPYEVVSENQLYAEAAGNDNGAFHSSAPVIKFDQIKIPAPKGIRGRVATSTNSIKVMVQFNPDFDMYVRDQCRVQGLQSGGKHGGEPLNNALVAWTRDDKSHIATRSGGTDYGAGGSGAGGCDSGQCGTPAPSPSQNGDGEGSPPFLSAQSDFGDPPSRRPFAYPPPYVQFEVGPSGGSVRKSYQTTALSGSIRFRRQIQIWGSLATLTVPPVISSPTDIGYLSGRRKGNGPAGAVYTTVDPADPSNTYPDLDVSDDFKEK